MIKRYILEKVDFDGNITIVGRYRTIYRALNWYALLTVLRFRAGIKDSIRYRIKELPLLFTVCKKNVFTKLSEEVKSFDCHDIAIYHCNNLNKNSDGTYIYYVNYSLVEED